MNQTCILILLTLVGSSVAGPAGPNLVVNGDFEKGKTAPDGWYVRVSHHMPATIRSVDGKVRSYVYICGCGAFLGTFKPWAGLVCPKCRGFTGDEEYGDWYLENFKRVSFDRGAKGKGRSIKFTLSKAVGEMQGVMIHSKMFRVKPNWGYILSFDVKANRAHPRVFAECYRYNRYATPGSAVLSTRDVVDWKALASAFNRVSETSKHDHVYRIWSLLTDDAKAILQKGAEGVELDRESKLEVVRALNNMLKRTDFYDAQAFKAIPIPEAATRFLKRPGNKEKQALFCFNRLLLGVALPGIVKKLPDDPKGCLGIDVSRTKRAIQGCYRAHVNCEGVTGWRHYTKEMVAPRRYKFEWITVKLYAYMPGQAWFDNVVLRPMTKAELEAFFVKKPRYKDRRFEW